MRAYYLCLHACSTRGRDTTRLGLLVSSVLPIGCAIQEDGSLNVYCATQSIDMMRGILSQITGLPANKVKVTSSSQRLGDMAASHSLSPVISCHHLSPCVTTGCIRSSSSEWEGPTVARSLGRGLQRQPQPMLLPSWACLYVASWICILRCASSASGE